MACYGDSFTFYFFTSVRILTMVYGSGFQPRVRIPLKYAKKSYGAKENILQLCKIEIIFCFVINLIYL
jgi:hypothetical protein